MVIAKVRKRAQFDVLAVKRLSTCSLGDMLLSDEPIDENDDVNIEIEDQFLYEVGGNIGQCVYINNNNVAIYMYRSVY